MRRRAGAKDAGDVTTHGPSAGGGSLEQAREATHANAFRRFDESPRQVVSGLALWLALAGIARSGRGGDGTPGESFRRAALGILLVLMTHCFLNARDGAMRNPHPGFWRALHGSTLWYALMAAVFLSVRHEDGVAIMEFLFPDVRRTGRGPMEGVGANQPVGGDSALGMDHLDCEITPANVRRQVFGLWFFAHAVGWWAKMLMLRDLWTCLVYSTVFELVELTLQCLVPEFQECWWDSAILDWLVANYVIGMNLGMLTQRLLNWPALNWSQDFPWMWKLKLAKMMSTIAPRSWIEYNWNPDNDPVSLVLNSVIWILMAVGEVNSFFLINIFQLPRDHSFNIIRQVFFCFAALPACEEWYEYTRHVRVYNTGLATKEYEKKYSGRKPRIGQTVWLLTVTISLETAAVVKYSLALGIFSKSKEFDSRYWGPWASAAILFLSYFVIHCRFFFGGVRRYPRWLKMLKWSSILPLLFLCRLYAF